MRYVFCSISNISFTVHGSEVVPAPEKTSPILPKQMTLCISPIEMQQHLFEGHLLMCQYAATCLNDNTWLQQHFACEQGASLQAALTAQESHLVQVVVPQAGPVCGEGLPDVVVVPDLTGNGLGGQNVFGSLEKIPIILTQPFLKLSLLFRRPVGSICKSHSPSRPSGLVASLQMRGCSRPASAEQLPEELITACHSTRGT